MTIKHKILMVMDTMKNTRELTVTPMELITIIINMTITEVIIQVDKPMMIHIKIIMITMEVMIRAVMVGIINLQYRLMQ